MLPGRCAADEVRRSRFQAPARGLLYSTSASAILLGLCLAGSIGCDDTVGPDAIAASVTITPTSPTLGFIGDTLTLIATARDANNKRIRGKRFTWLSWADWTATVDTLGLVTAMEFGGATISAKADGAAGEALVTVTQQLATVTVDPASVSLTRVGQARWLTAVAQDGGGEPIADRTFTWESSNRNVATVSPAGLVTAVGNGDATITARTGGVSDSALVAVHLVPWIEVTPNGAAVSGVGATQTFTAAAWDAGGNRNPSPSVTWSSLNPEVATINAATGVATAVASGQVTIAANVAGLVGYALVTVSVPGVSPVGSWTVEVAPAFQYSHFYGLWGSSSSDVYAVGTYGTIAHCDGTSWSAITSGTTQYLYALWGTSSNEVYAVGRGGIVVHYDGTSWTDMIGSMNGYVYYGRLWGVWGTSSGDVYAVGVKRRIQHYDGTSWSAMTRDLDNLLAVWGTSSTDVYAVGDRGRILHYDGAGWSAMTSGTMRHLYDVWGTSSSDVYAVGYCGTILHYDGTGWSPMASDAYRHLYALWGTSSSDIYAVGSYGTIVHYDGTAWSSTSNVTEEPLRGVWGTSAGDVYVVGDNGLILRGTR
jgi:uncharacterized protein YjdB